MRAWILVFGLQIACHGDKPIESPATRVGATWLRVGAKGVTGSAALHGPHGAFVGDVRLELVTVGLARWELAVGPLRSPPKIETMPLLDGCLETSIAATRERRFFQCTREDHVFRVFDEHGTVLYSRSGVQPGRGRLWAISELGDLLIEGACVYGEDCAPLVRSADRSLHVVPNALDQEFFAVRVTPGGMVVAAGLDRSGVTSVYVSRNHGRTFHSTRVPFVTDLTGEEWLPYVHVGTVHADDVGRVVVLSRAKNWLRWESSDFGMTFTGKTVSIDVESIDLAGARGLAYADSGATFETNDAGATWHRVAAAPLGIPRNDIRELVACTVSGCLVDVKLARLGWDLP